MQRHWLRFICLAAITLAAIPNAVAAQNSELDEFVRVSPRDSRYLELSAGSPFIPIGINMVSVRGDESTDGLARMDEWMGRLAAAGTFCRVVG